MTPWRVNATQFGRKLENPFDAADRLLCSFSCGVTSAVATKIALHINNGRLPVEIIYMDTGSEHEDSMRFLHDCEDWFGHKVSVLRSEKYENIWDVFERTGYITGVRGARCTTELKKVIRERYERTSDLQVFGFDASPREHLRAARFKFNQPEIMTWFPLLDSGCSKARAKTIVSQAGIELPIMYQLGFDNNNCIGCPKGGNEYWNKIRRFFPEVFLRMCEVSRAKKVRLIKITVKGVRVRAFLDELPLDAIDDVFVDMSCGVVCSQPETAEIGEV